MRKLSGQIMNIILARMLLALQLVHTIELVRLLVDIGCVHGLKVCRAIAWSDDAATWIDKECHTCNVLPGLYNTYFLAFFSLTT